MEAIPFGIPNPGETIRLALSVDHRIYLHSRRTETCQRGVEVADLKSGSKPVLRGRPRLLGMVGPPGGRFGSYMGHDDPMITGLGNLAVKVTDLDAAIAFYEGAGAVVRDRMTWRDAERADVYFGPLQITLFTKAIYEDAVDVPPEGFLHVALFTDNLDRQLEGHEVLWGPALVEGTFGKRRIAFIAAPSRIRLEFMEQLEPAKE